MTMTATMTAMMKALSTLVHHLVLGTLPVPKTIGIVVVAAFAAKADVLEAESGRPLRRRS
jgi:hypothetical protein